MTDHATWVSFTNEELSILNDLLDLTERATSGDDDDVEVMNDLGIIRARIAIYNAPEAKDQAYRDAAEQMRFVREGECEIDDHAVVSASDEGAYVMAWVWVPNADD